MRTKKKRNNNNTPKKVTAERKVCESKRITVRTFMENEQYLIQRAAELQKKRRKHNLTGYSAWAARVDVALAKDEGRTLLNRQPMTLTIATSIKLFYIRFWISARKNKHVLILQICQFCWGQMAPRGAMGADLTACMRVCLFQAWCPRPRCAYQPWSQWARWQWWTSTCWSRACWGLAVPRGLACGSVLRCC